MELTQEEREIIRRFRQLPEDCKDLIRGGLGIPRHTVSLEAWKDSKQERTGRNRGGVEKLDTLQGEQLTHAAHVADKDRKTGGTGAYDNQATTKQAHRLRAATVKQ